jgi:hypothetical protein
MNLKCSWDWFLWSAACEIQDSCLEGDLCRLFVGSIEMFCSIKSSWELGHTHWQTMTVPGHKVWYATEWQMDAVSRWCCFLQILCPFCCPNFSQNEDLHKQMHHPKGHSPHHFKKLSCPWCDGIEYGSPLWVCNALSNPSPTEILDLKTYYSLL